MIECDVAIIGSGPAGSAAARECTRKGLKTVIVEKKKIPRHNACSGILVPDSINILSEHFGNAPQDVLAIPSHVNAMRMHFPGGYVGDIPIHGLMYRSIALNKRCLRGGFIDKKLRQKKERPSAHSITKRFYSERAVPSTSKRDYKQWAGKNVRCSLGIFRGGF